MAVKSLVDLVANSEIQANVAGSLSKLVEITVPRGKFIYFSDRPQVLRLNGYEVQRHTLTSGEISDGEFDTAALTDQPCKPPADLLPTYPTKDGQIFKVYLRHYDRTYGGGAWTQATINAVDWNNKQLTIALPDTLPDYAGNDHTLVANDLIDVRISYPLSSGKILLYREAPLSERLEARKVAWQSSPYALNVKDQYDVAGRWSFPALVWAPEKCRITIWVDVPVAVDIDPDYGATTINLEYVLDDLARAEARYLEFHALTGRPLKYRTLYQAFLAQLSGIEPEALPF